jgi:hypothetical protein
MIEMTTKWIIQELMDAVIYQTAPYKVLLNIMQECQVVTDYIRSRH